MEREPPGRPEDSLKNRKGSADTALPIVYEQLRRLAARKLASDPAGKTLQPTALVHEAYLSLKASKQEVWDGPGHFYGAAAEAMRRILIHRAREKLAQKRGGGMKPETLRDTQIGGDVPSDELLALNDALERLESELPDHAEVVKLRFFAGMTTNEIGVALELSTRSVERKWAYARAWLHSEMQK